MPTFCLEIHAYSLSPLSQTVCMGKNLSLNKIVGRIYQQIDCYGSMANIEVGWGEVGGSNPNPLYIYFNKPELMY